MEGEIYSKSEDVRKHHCQSSQAKIRPKHRDTDTEECPQNVCWTAVIQKKTLVNNRRVSIVGLRKLGSSQDNRQDNQAHW